MQVASYIHKAIEAVKANKSGLLAPSSITPEASQKLRIGFKKRNRDEHVELLTQMQSNPVFVMDETLANDLRSNLTRETGVDLIKASLANDSFRLPMPVMTLEYPRKSDHYIVHLIEAPSTESLSGYEIHCTIFLYSKSIRVENGPTTDKDGFAAIPFTTYRVRIEGDSFCISYSLDADLEEDIVESVARSDSQICTSAVLLAIFGLRTRGLTHTDIPVSKLNKARLSAGKPKIADHVVIRLTHYEDKNGNSVKVGGRTVRLHWRRPHWRHIRFGPGKTQKRLERIEAVWVNYQHDTVLPEKPKTYIVKR